MTRDLAILGIGYALGAVALGIAFAIGAHTRNSRRAAWLQVQHDAERVAMSWRCGSDINLSDALEGLTQSVEHAHAAEVQ